jgi:hypothetical protein
MDIQEVDIIGAELSKGSLHRDMQRFRTVASIKSLLGDGVIPALEVDRVLQVGWIFMFEGSP